MQYFVNVWRKRLSSGGSDHDVWYASMGDGRFEAKSEEDLREKVRVAVLESEAELRGRELRGRGCSPDDLEAKLRRRWTIRVVHKEDPEEDPEEPMYDLFD